MKRVQIYLEDKQYKRLKSISNGRDLAKLIRQAIDIIYPERDISNFNRIIDNVAGIWKDRKDIKISRKSKTRKEYLASVWNKKR